MVFTKTKRKRQYYIDCTSPFNRNANMLLTLRNGRREWTLFWATLVFMKTAETSRTGVAGRWYAFPDLTTPNFNDYSNVAE